MKTKTLTSSLCSAAVSIATAACATTAQPPPELVDARQAYAASLQSEAAHYDPAGLHDAKGALDNAERLFKSESDSQQTRDAAYVATRRAQISRVEGETIALQQQRRDAERAARSQTTKAQADAAAQLRATREQLNQAQQALQQTEQQAQDMMTQLQSSSSQVTQQGNDTVITVAGGFLFPSNKATLRNESADTLDKIAFVLKQRPDTEILVEGHTDSSGADDRNQELSEERAQSVASYLEAHGVPRDKITTKGLGASDPVASNESREGRAANRRVTIVVRRKEG